MDLPATHGTAVASFYPSRISVLTVRVLGKRTAASHDAGTANHEVRHFIDHAFLLELPGGAEMLDRLMQPSPPCSIVSGTGAHTPVIGMLPEPLGTVRAFRLSAPAPLVPPQ